MSGKHHAGRRARRIASALALSALAAAVFIAPAGATNGPHGPRYAITISTGATTFPEYESVVGTWAGVEPRAEVILTIVHGGIPVSRDIGEGWASLSQVPQPGDTVTLESPAKTVVAATVYDGLPTIDASVCAPSTGFSGTNSSGNTVTGFYFLRTPKFDPYGHFEGMHQAAFGEAQVKLLSGTSFGGSFLTPLAVGETVGAVESLKTPLAGEATYTYTSETQRPVAACPPPPPPYSPPPAPALQGAIAKLLRTSIHALLHGPVHDVVTINQVGTVTQDLYLSNGAVPAVAAAVKAKRRPAALLLARGQSAASAAGKVTVTLKLTRKGRQRLKKMHKAKAVLVTTLRTSTGVRVNLTRHTLNLHR